MTPCPTSVSALAKGQFFWHDFVMQRTKRLTDAYRFPGFRPRSRVVGIFGDPVACLIALYRRGKKPSAQPAGRLAGRIMIGDCAGSAISPVAIGGSIWNWRLVESSVGSVAG